MSRADEAVKVGSAMKSQLSCLSQLESDNKQLTEDNSYLRYLGFSFVPPFTHSLPAGWPLIWNKWMSRGIRYG